MAANWSPKHTPRLDSQPRLVITLYNVDSQSVLLLQLYLFSGLTFINRCGGAWESPVKVDCFHDRHARLNFSSDRQLMLRYFAIASVLYLYVGFLP